MSQYPSADIEKSCLKPQVGCLCARIVSVVPESPADDAGFEPGCMLTSVDGQPLRDIIDWRWLTSEDSIVVDYIDLDGDEGSVRLTRESGEDWGFEFDGLIFDEVMQCRNACTFCFMRQLPRGMRDSLYLRDDDFRLSFLVGTFVTLSNLSAEDEQRIIEQRISPLRVSLQASGDEVRERLIGKHAVHGKEVLERLLAAGIKFHAQVVLVPGENDGDALRETLNWAYERPGILNVGIVPLGHTRHQSCFTRSFNEPEEARAVLELLKSFQRKAQVERGHAWVFAADEFYRNAYRDDLLAHIPPVEHYGDYELFEDGIGIIRSTIDDWESAAKAGLIEACECAAARAGVRIRLVAGCAQREFLDTLVRRPNISDWFAPLYVQNSFFGGNVDVTGLLTASDIVAAIHDELHANAAADSKHDLFLIPRVVFNDDGLTLDDATLEDMKSDAGVHLSMVSCSPLNYFEEIAALLKQAAH